MPVAPDAILQDQEGRSVLRAQPPPGKDDERLPSDWRELNTAYEERFGIPPEKATPPPKD